MASWGRPRREIDLYFDAQSIDAVERCAVDFGEHSPALKPPYATKGLAKHN